MSDEPTECPHFGRPLEFPTECTICSGADARLRAEQTEAPVLVLAAYQSRCPECDQMIHWGDSIAWFPGHTRPTVHSGCLA